MHTVRAGDTLSQLALDHLGDADAYPRIVEASTAITQPDGRHLTDPDLIVVGWQLHIPTALTRHQPPDPTDTASVIPAVPSTGGDPATAPHPAPDASSTGTRPPPLAASLPPDWTPAGGWPTGSGRHATTGPASAGTSSAGSPSASVPGPTGGPTPAVTPDPAGTPSGPEAAPEPGVVVAPWRVAGLTGAGAVLAAAVAVSLARRRRRQRRHRRPGRVVPAVPVELAEVDKTVHAVASVTGPTLVWLEQVLRRLGAVHAATGSAVPALAAVELTEDAAVVHLATGCDLEKARRVAGHGPADDTVWQPHHPDRPARPAGPQPADPGTPDRAGAGRCWALPVQTPPDHVGPDPSDQPDPYPLLVTIGTDTTTGSVWLVNLEDHVLTITPADLAADLASGPAVTGAGTGQRGAAAVDLARYVAAEVACHPWARTCRVDAVGLGPEVAGLNPDRVTAHTIPPSTPDDVAGDVLADAVTTIDRARAVGQDVPTARAAGAGPDSWPARLLITTTTPATPPAAALAGADSPARVDPSWQAGPATADLTDLLTRHHGHTGTGVVLVTDPADHHDHPDRTGPADAQTDTPPGDPPGDLSGPITLHVAGAVARMHHPWLSRPVDLHPVGLTRDEAHGCALLLTHGDDLTDTPPPPAGHDLPATTRADNTRAAAPPTATPLATSTSATAVPRTVATPTGGGSDPGDWRSWADQTGALRTHHTALRTPSPATHPPSSSQPGPPALPASTGAAAPVDPPPASPGPGQGSASAPTADPAPTPASPPAQSPGSQGSVLPAADQEYVAVAATTVQDLQAVAPAVPAAAAAGVRRADPGLDDDVAAWFAEDCPLPRLSLLGPVTARTRGVAVTKRKPYWTEVLAYIALHRHGVRPDELADAFSITNAKAREYVRVVREWLGPNPRSGGLHLPHAADAPAATARGIAVYQTVDVLVDVDLFRRLRLRGQSSGPDGITDLATALHLVTGRPFDRLRPGGWAWLTEADRLDEHMVCAVVDVAHTVTVHALHTDDLDLARWAAETAALAAPAEEIPRLDLAAIAYAHGHHATADHLLHDHITDRSDSDDNAPDDLPDRTTQILTDHQWTPRRRAAS